MFKEMLPLLRQRTVMMTVSALSETELRVNIIPKQTGESENTALTTPLSVTGSAEELDKELPNAIVEFVAKHLTLKQSLDQTKAEIDAAEKQAKEDAKNKVKTISKGKTTATSTTKPADKTEAAKPEPPKAPAPPSLFDTPAEPAKTETTAAPSPTPVAATPAPQVAAAATDEDEAEEGDEVSQADEAYAARASAGSEQQQMMIA